MHLWKGALLFAGVVLGLSPGLDTALTQLVLALIPLSTALTALIYIEIRSGKKQ